MARISGKHLSEEEKSNIAEAVQRHIKNGGTATSAARELGIRKMTVRRVAREMGADKISENVEFPAFVTDEPDEEPIEEILGRLKRAQDRKKKEIAARTWFPIRIKETKPYGILWFGDPHLGVNTDWDLLNAHIEVAKQDGVYGGNIGDTTDAWPWTGRLAKLWSEADISRKTEQRLAKWFMFDAGISWLVWLLGNHDAWNMTEFYKELGAFQVPVEDWRAQFRLVHNNKTETRIDAAHGRKGSSIYNPTHGTLREAKFGEQADAFITGHTHNFGIFEIEFAEKKQKTHLVQISGYKISGLYDTTNGFAQSNHGAGVLQVIDPETGRSTFFSDPVEGARYLAWRRAA